MCHEIGNTTHSAVSHWQINDEIELFLRKEISQVSKFTGAGIFIDGDILESPLNGFHLFFKTFIRSFIQPDIVFLQTSPPPPINSSYRILQIDILTYLCDDKLKIHSTSYTEFLKRYRIVINEYYIRVRNFLHTSARI